MDKIIIEGGASLKGEVKIGGAKNAALPILVSSLLTDGECTFSNVPNLNDIESILQLLAHLGARIDKGKTCTRIDAGGLCNHEAPYDLVRKMRASILVLCPLVARLKKASVRAERLKGNDIYFDIVTVTGTENLMMAAALAEGVTTLHNAAQEPEIVALADVLNRMGADIKGAGTPVITITGVASLQPVDAAIIPDRIEAGTFMVASALTGGEITLTDCEPEHLDAVIQKLRLTGATVDVGPRRICVKGAEEIVSVDVKTFPYPGFPTDMQAQFMVLMSVGNGTSIISETIFENRFIHVSELRRLGADITITGNTAMIQGVPKLSGAPVMATDLRASASLVLAGLAAEGQTTVNRVYHLDRGYEALDEKFSMLGARIKRVKA